MITLRKEEYIAEVMPDGHLSLPEKIAERLNLKLYNRVRVVIRKSEENSEKSVLSDKAKQKALAIKEFISDMGTEDLSEKFRERYK